MGWPLRRQHHDMNTTNGYAKLCSADAHSLRACFVYRGVSKDLLYDQVGCAMIACGGRCSGVVNQHQVSASGAIQWYISSAARLHRTPLLCLCCNVLLHPATPSPDVSTRLVRCATESNRFMSRFLKSSILFQHTLQTFMHHLPSPALPAGHSPPFPCRLLPVASSRNAEGSAVHVAGVAFPSSSSAAIAAAALSTSRAAFSLLLAVSVEAGILVVFHTPRIRQQRLLGEMAYLSALKTICLQTVTAFWGCIYVRDEGLLCRVVYHPLLQNKQTHNKRVQCGFYGYETDESRITKQSRS